MPEGPEVKTVATTLNAQLKGKVLGALWHSEHSLRRCPDYSALERFRNLSIQRVTSYGKVIFVHANNNPIVFAQLGMTGQLLVEPSAKPVSAHTHIRWKLQNTKSELRYIDPRRFGMIDFCNETVQEAILAKLGPDPFMMKASDVEIVIGAIKQSRRNIKAILLDQSIIAGVGNIYASEALFLARIDPRKLGCEINVSKLRALISVISQVLMLAYQNCGTTFSSYVDGYGNTGENLKYLKVFQREGKGCPHCLTNPIIRIKQNGRSTFYCAQCQT